MIIPIGSSCFGHRQAEIGEPVWDLATFFPAQGAWTEVDYLALDSNRMIELTDGVIEVLPLPTLLHQLIVKFLFMQFDTFVAENHGGLVLFAPLPVKFRRDLYREPDILYLSPERIEAMGDAKYPQGAELAVKVVSDGDEARECDYESKRTIYAEFGVLEYWIVDSETQQITVLSLDEGSKTYRDHGKFAMGQRATSVLFEGFTVAVDEVFSHPTA
jgi:Uma2 family endonuclease